MSVINIKPEELSRHQVFEINELTASIWPKKEHKEKNETERFDDFLKRNGQKTCHLLQRNGILAGYAESFPKNIKSEGKEITVLGLASVCVHKEFRGHGYGVSLVQAAFERIDSGEFPIALFQTGVSEFYNKLGCKISNNRFINSLSKTSPEKNPFYDKYVMTYAKNFSLPREKIDLLGNGY